jgi:hypothetical protein
MENNIEEFYCHLCNFRTKNITNWFRHNETNKHKRNGNLLPKDCSLCDYKATNHWNLKMHHASVHSTLEERQNYKYYCNTCDLVFFCEAYYNKHNEGIRHKNILKAIELQLKINGIVKNE